MLIVWVNIKDPVINIEQLQQERKRQILNFSYIQIMKKEILLCTYYL